MPSQIELQHPRLEIRHQIPGRIRLHVPALREDPLLHERLTQALSKIEGVRGVRCNAVCASLIVWHRRAESLTQDELSRILHPALQHAVLHQPARVKSRVIAVAPETSKMESMFARSRWSSFFIQAPRLTKTAATLAHPSWHSWLNLPKSRSLLQSNRDDARKSATLRLAKPHCRLCQLKLTLARWVFNDVWRCWTSALTTQSRPQAR